MQQATAVFPLCSLTKSDGSRCTGAALPGMNFCFHHIGGKTSHLRAASNYSPELDLVPAGTREALQHNFSTVALALSDGKIDLRMANTYLRIYRTAEQNLTRWEKANKDNPDKQMLPLSPKHSLSAEQTSNTTNDVILSETGALADRSSSVGWEESAANAAKGPALHDASITAIEDDDDEYDALKDKTLREGMTYKYPSVEYTYELRDRIHQRHQEHAAKKRAREQANDQPSAA